jgi:diaminopimelate epimerase
MRFAKYHGTGNDFVLIEDLDDELRLSPELIARICDRHRGVGADGLIRIVRGTGAAFFMDYSNADGRTAEMCGNGIRCLAKYVYDRGLTPASRIDVMTRAGIKHVGIQASGGVAVGVTVDMGTPAFERGAIPMTGDPSESFIGQPLRVDGTTLTATALSMGNPHVVLFLGDMDPADVEVGRLGPLVEGRDEFPNRTNVEFVRIVDGVIQVRVWERGSGETMACGTGACAALVGSFLAGLAAREADVDFPGGRLRVAWDEQGHVSLTGPAVLVFDGDLDAGWLSGKEPWAGLPAGVAR